METGEKLKGELIEALPEIESAQEIKKGGRYAIVFPTPIHGDHAANLQQTLNAEAERLECKFILIQGPVEIYDLDAKSNAT